jgi:hypothetical protein
MFIFFIILEKIALNTIVTVTEFKHLNSGLYEILEKENTKLIKNQITILIVFIIIESVYVVYKKVKKKDSN